MKQMLIFWGTMGLAAIGILESLRTPAGRLFVLIPFALFLVVFLLYKYPPRRYRRTPKIKPSQRTIAKAAASKRRPSSSVPKRKDYPFHVIEGKKGKSDDDTPRYH